MLDGSQQKQGEEGPPRDPEQTHPVRVERIGPLGHRDAHRLCPYLGQGPLSASTDHCRPWLGPHLPGALSQVRAHPSSSPRCTTGGGLLHSSLSREEVFAQNPLQAAECLSCSTAIYRISKFLIPRLPLLKSWEIFPRPTPRRLCCLGLPQQAQKKKQGMLSILRILLRAHDQTEVRLAGEDGPGCRVGIFYGRISF